MRRSSLLSTISLLTGFALLAPFGSDASQANPQPATTYPETEDGFRKQLNAAIDAYKAGDAAAGQRLIEQFGLPDPNAWFAENFHPDQSARLVDRYTQGLTSFAAFLAKMIDDVVHHHGFDLVATLKPGEPAAPAKMHAGYELAALTPLKEQALYRFNFSIRENRQEASSWMETYVYHDRAFRFIGFGAWPIWAWKEGAEPGGFKGGHFISRPVVIHQVPPSYPIGAMARHVEGIVRLKLWIDKDGSVRKAELVEGHPLLVEAATDAVRQWRFKPGTIGGSPMASQVIVDVAFHLTGR